VRKREEIAAAATDPASIEAFHAEALAADAEYDANEAQLAQKIAACPVDEAWLHNAIAAAGSARMTERLSDDGEAPNAAPADARREAEATPPSIAPFAAVQSHCSTRPR